MPVPFRFAYPISRPMPRPESPNRILARMLLPILEANRRIGSRRYETDPSEYDGVYVGRAGATSAFVHIGPTDWDSGPPVDRRWNAGTIIECHRSPADDGSYEMVSRIEIGVPECPAWASGQWDPNYVTMLADVVRAMLDHAPFA